MEETEVTQSQSWKDELPEDIRDDPSLAAIQDIPSLAKSYVHAQRLVGRERIPIPAADSPPETWENVYDRLGRPKDPSGYEIALREDAEVDNELLDNFRSQAHKLGLLPKQVQGIVDWFLEQSERARTELESQAEQNNFLEQEKVIEEAMARLKYKYGPDTEKAVARARVVARGLGGEGFIQYLEQTGLGNSPELIMFLDQVANTLGEDKVKSLGVASRTLGTTPEEARLEIERIKQDPNHPYWKGDPGAVRLVQELYKAAYR